MDICLRCLSPILGQKMQPIFASNTIFGNKLFSIFYQCLDFQVPCALRPLKKPTRSMLIFDSISFFTIITISILIVNSTVLSGKIWVCGNKHSWNRIFLLGSALRQRFFLSLLLSSSLWLFVSIIIIFLPSPLPPSSPSPPQLPPSNLCEHHCASVSNDYQL